MAAALAAPQVAGGGQLVLNNVTIADNIAYHDGGGLFVGSAMTLRNTVIADNRAPHGDDCMVVDDTWTVTSGGHNFISIGGVPIAGLTAVACLPGAGTDSVGTLALPLDAELGLLADHGGPTATHDLGPGSPLRDGGDPDGCDDENGVPLDDDQRGESRVVGAACDIGAFEAPPPSPALDFYLVSPCRLADTRVGTPLIDGIERDLPVAGVCGVPASAAVASLNLTAVEPTGSGAVSAYPRDTPPPSPPGAAALLPLVAGRTRANNALVALADAGVSVEATVSGGGSVDLVLDISGYFSPNAWPVAVDDAYSIASNTAAVDFAVLGNDTDTEGDPILIVAVSQPLHGTVAISGGGTQVTYTSSDGYCSLANGVDRNGPPDSFMYEIAPGGATAMVRVERTCTGCLAAGTLVWAETGLRPIEDLAPGDRVWARDDASGDLRLQGVEWVTTWSAPGVVEIDLGDEAGALRATVDHPFWTANGWTRAGDLVAGDLLVSRDGGQVAIRRITAVPGAATVHNLHVAGFHTFFVGPAGVWVHNK